MQRGFTPNSEGFINLHCDWKFLAVQVGGRTKAPNAQETALQLHPRVHEITSTLAPQTMGADGVKRVGVTCVDDMDGTV